MHKLQGLYEYRISCDNIISVIENDYDWNKEDDKTKIMITLI